jgi:rhodanese-related sulfurtransferase
MMVAQISREQLQQALAERSVVALDAQGAGWYERERLPGAVRARPEDLRELEQRLQRGKDTAVVVYCWSDTCTASQQMAEQLDALGYRDVRRYAAGKRDWIEAGLPVEGSEA